METKRTDTGEKLDLLQNKINRRDLLNINNDYNISSSDNEEPDTPKSTISVSSGSNIIDPSDLQDIKPINGFPIGLRNKTSSFSSSSSSSYFKNLSNTNNSFDSDSIPTTPLNDVDENNYSNEFIIKNDLKSRKQHNKEKPSSKLRSSTISSDFSDSDITLDNLVKYVSSQDDLRTIKHKKPKEHHHKHKHEHEHEHDREHDRREENERKHEHEKERENKEEDRLQEFNKSNENHLKDQQIAKLQTNKIKKNFQNDKYRLRFSDLSFKPQSTTIFDSNSFLNSEFFGIYVLFWLATLFVMINNLIHMYFEGAKPIWNWDIILILKKDLIKVAITDGIMYLMSFFPFLLQFLNLKKLLSWNKFGWIIFTIYETGFFFVFLWFSHYMEFPWIARVFLALHSLVFVMKMHSYSFYNGYLWSILNEGLFSENYLLKLNNNEVKLPEGHELQKTIEILKTSIEFTKLELEYQSRAISNKPEQDQHKSDESRLDLDFKDLQNSNIIKFPSNINFYNYFEYSMFPTLVYTINYPRTSKIRWLYVFSKTCAVFGLIFLMILIAQNNMFPIFYRTQTIKKLPINERIPQYFFVLLDMIPPFLMEYLFTFFLIWDSILNVLAELTLFADREFYGPWWSCTDFSDFARLWNKPVHNFLLRHVYHSSISALKVNKIQAAMLTFIISSIVHELVMYVIFGTLRGYLLLFQMSQIPLIMMSRTKFMRNKKVLGNIICWFGFISGPSIICTLYLIF
ncbi:ARE2 [Candida pseudojiufengensis]|uniref:ARE2 n=1 Tax=Candida pseudojiufengensis TaxID=497109 RepID=UPI00222470CB|nr:ARE2 [Candida pseudojiufengensis]KAI5965287.1 ARE2 [Candida pseudojiufengensis]